MIVEMLSMPQANAITGIGRYWSNLQKHFTASFEFRPIQPKFLPASQRFTFLQSFPIGYWQHQKGRLIHFPQIVGCSAMLGEPAHPSVATVHDLGSLVLAEELKMLDPIARLSLRLSLAGLKRVGKIICVSEFTRQSVIQNLKVLPEKVITIHSGIDHDCFHPNSEARAIVLKKYPQLGEQSAPWLLYVGSELPRKNLSVLLEAVARLRERYPEMRLIKIGGSGGARFRQALHQIIHTLELANAVYIYENIPNEDLALFYAAANLLVQPSKLEGFSFPVLEAMASGTPVVCAGAASLPEITDGAARLVSATDVQAWAQAIEQVLSNPSQRQEMAQRGLERASQFSWQETARQTAEIYWSLLG